MPLLTRPLAYACSLYAGVGLLNPFVPSVLYETLRMYPAVRTITLVLSLSTYSTSRSQSYPSAALKIPGSLPSTPTMK
jgi:hypothetical protein